VARARGPTQKGTNGRGGLPNQIRAVAAGVTVLRIGRSGGPGADVAAGEVSADGRGT
jgi:hypothetical protein